MKPRVRAAALLLAAAFLAMPASPREYDRRTFDPRAATRSAIELLGNLRFREATEAIASIERQEPAGYRAPFLKSCMSVWQVFMSADRGSVTRLREECDRTIAACESGAMANEDDARLFRAAACVFVAKASMESGKSVEAFIWLARAKEASRPLLAAGLADACLFSACFDYYLAPGRGSYRGDLERAFSQGYYFPSLAAYLGGLFNEETGDWKGAKAILEPLVRDYPGNSLYWYLFGKSLQHLHEPLGALEAFRRSISELKVEPPPERLGAETWFALGQLLENDLHDNAAAMAAYASVKSIARSDYAPVRRLRAYASLQTGNCLSRQGDKAAAMESWQMVRKADDARAWSLASEAMRRSSAEP